MFNNVKIYKSATQKSIMDITSALDYHKEKQNGELEFKGKLVFAITEMGAQSKYEKAFVSKSGAKALFHSMVNGKFQDVYQNGFAEYGGSRTQDGIRARVFSVKMSQKKQFIFQIDEGAGKLGANGSIQMAQKQTTVQTYVAFEEALKLAHEVYDFIREAEMVSMMKGKPYFTIVPDRNGSEQDTKNNTQPTNYSLSDGYIIKIGNLKGTPINTLDSQVLTTIVNKLVPDSPEKKELIEEAKAELARK